MTTTNVIEVAYVFAPQNVNLICGMKDSGWSVMRIARELHIRPVVILAILRREIRRDVAKGLNPRWVLG